MSKQPIIDFVVITVSDIEASFRYYTEVLGFTLGAELHGGPNFRYLKGAPGCVDFGLNLADKQHPAGTVVLYFKTDDAESLHAEFISKGVAVSPLQHPPFGTIFNLPSPDGEALIMAEPH